MSEALYGTEITVTNAFMDKLCRQKTARLILLDGTCKKLYSKNCPNISMNTRINIPITKWRTIEM